jgi:hypothetical protein
MAWEKLGTTTITGADYGGSSLKETPDYTFNFSSDTDWTQTTAGTSNTVYIDTSAGNLRHNTTTNTSAMKKVHYDLTDYTSGSAVNDSKWTMRFKWVVTSQNAPSSWLMALSGNTTDPDSSGFNGIGIQLNDQGGSYGYHITTCDGSTKTFSSNVTTPSNSQTLYFELKRTSATNATLTCWSDSYGGTQVGTTQSLTIPSGVTSLVHLQSGSGQGGNSSRTMNATLDDLEIFDNSAQVDATSDVITVDSLTAKKHLMVQVKTFTVGGNTKPAMRFNNDTGNNYATRDSQDGGTDATETTVSEIRLSQDGHGGTVGMFASTINVINEASKEKLIIADTVRVNATGAGTAPARYEIVSKWANTSNAITRVDIINEGTGDFSEGSEVTVYGTD